MNKPQKLYLEAFGVIVIILALARCVFPSIAGSLNAEDNAADSLSTSGIDSAGAMKTDTMVAISLSTGASSWTPLSRTDEKKEYTIGDKHPIVGVLSYSKTFPDSNDVHLVDAMK